MPPRSRSAPPTQQAVSALPVPIWNACAAPPRAHQRFQCALTCKKRTQQEPAGHLRLIALPHDPLSAICRRASLHSNATPAHIASSCKALLFALLGNEGARLTLDVTFVNLTM